MGDYTAFFYGTLMAPGVLHRVIYGSATPEEWQKDLTTVRPAILHSYQRHRVKYADYPAIIAKEGSSVRGTIVNGLTQGDIYRLDIFEGSQYTRERVRVKVLRGDALDNSRDCEEEDLEEAQTYVWKDPVNELEEEEWDFEEFKKDKMRAWMGEVEGYTEVDGGFADVYKAVAHEEAQEKEKEKEAARKDPSGGRVNGKIARELENAAV